MRAVVKRAGSTVYNLVALGFLQTVWGIRRTVVRVPPAVGRCSMRYYLAGVVAFVAHGDCHVGCLFLVDIRAAFGAR